jgi:hypothetical protein
MTETTTSRSLTWISTGWRLWALHNDEGRILGRVDGGYRQFNASIETRPLGSYISVEAAQSAVEKALFLRPESIRHE